MTRLITAVLLTLFAVGAQPESPTAKTVPEDNVTQPINATAQIVGYCSPFENPNMFPHGVRDACRNQILNMIESANVLLVIAMYNFTDPEIADAIIRLAVQPDPPQIYVLLDDGTAAQANSQWDELDGYVQLVAIEAQSRYGSGLFHNKVMLSISRVADRYIYKYATGSYNFTNSAYTRNYENWIALQVPRDTLKALLASAEVPEIIHISNSLIPAEGVSLSFQGRRLLDGLSGSGISCNAARTEEVYRQTVGQGYGNMFFAAPAAIEICAASQEEPNNGDLP